MILFAFLITRRIESFAGKSNDLLLLVLGMLVKC
jgi:hypothetical protein